MYLYKEGYKNQKVKIYSNFESKKQINDIIKKNKKFEIFYHSSLKL